MEKGRGEENEKGTEWLTSNQSRIFGHLIQMIGMKHY